MIDIDHNPIETEEGVWTTFRDTRMRIAHVSCMAFQRKLARLQQPHAKRIAKGTLSPDEQKNILCKAMAGTILRDAEFFRKVRNSDGSVVMENGAAKMEPVPFSEQVAELVLINQFDVREFVTEFSSDLDHFRQEEAEAVGKS